MKAIRDLQGANYLTVAGKQVKDIQFYAEGCVMEGCHTGKGWFGKGNYQHCSELAEMEVSNRRTVDAGMRAGGAFFIPKTGVLYLDADDFEFLEYQGEIKVAEDENSICYGDVTKICMTLDGVKDTYSFMATHYTRVENKGKALVAQKLRELLPENCDDKFSMTQFIAENPEAVIKILQGE